MTSLHPIRVERNPCNTQRERTLVRSSEIETTRMGVEWTAVRVEYRFCSPRLRASVVETRPRNSTREKKKRGKKKSIARDTVSPRHLRKENRSRNSICTFVRAIPQIRA